MGNVTSVELQLNMTQNALDIKICENYWAYDNKGSFIEHVKTLYEQYKISTQVLFETIARYYAHLDNVVCEYCGYTFPIEVTAVIPYMRSKDGQFCAMCKNTLCRKHQVGK